MYKPKIGLALGGGGARGLAHIGVLKVFEREGIPIDALSGSSMGGLLGAAYAAGLSPSDLESELSEIKLQKAKPDLVIIPALPNDFLVFTGFVRSAEAIAAGEKAAIEMLPRIHELIRKTS